MQVVLKKKVKKLGNEGDIVSVADGYANSFLIPKGLAVVATKDKVADTQNKKQIALSQKERHLAAEKNLFNQITAKKYSHKGKANPKGQLFAGLNKKAIAVILNTESKFIDLDTPIKDLGTHTVPIKVGPNKGKVEITVEAE